MLGANYAFPECTVSRTAKYQGNGIFQIPTRDMISMLTGGTILLQF